MIGRAEARQALREPFDLIVVGGGVNGTGIARDAALRGLRVLLLDKGDFGSGTTSWSSRLIHGGLRYLEHREIGLVRESLRERERLLAMAPHLVKPLPLIIPLYKGARRGPNLVRLGMIAYDILSFDKSLDRHRMLSTEEALTRAPGLAEGRTPRRCPLLRRPGRVRGTVDGRECHRGRTGRRGDNDLCPGRSLAPRRQRGYRRGVYRSSQR